ncbi:MAG TPA: SMI1/KNR4 family protein [Verrucomicrobiae bacterium]
MKSILSRLEGITWRGPAVDDSELLAELPPDLAELLREVNGFLLHGGALHFRGASLVPAWHSLRAAIHDAEAFHHLYDLIEPADIPFAQDLFGDQFLLRDGTVLRLFAETGEIEALSPNLEDFLTHLCDDYAEFLNVQPGNLKPGQLVLAYPPFCVEESGKDIDQTPLPAREVIHFHAALANQLKDVPEGAKIKFNLNEPQQSDVGM